MVVTKDSSRLYRRQDRNRSIYLKTPDNSGPDPDQPLFLRITRRPGSVLGVGVGGATQRAVLCWDPTAQLPGLTGTPHEEDPVLRGHLSALETFRPHDMCITGGSPCPGLKEPLMYPAGRSAPSPTPPCGFVCSRRWVSSQAASAASLLCWGLSWFLLGSGSYGRTLSLWVSPQFKLLPAFQSPWKGSLALSKHFFGGPENSRTCQWLPAVVLSVLRLDLHPL